MKNTNITQAITYLDAAERIMKVAHSIDDINNMNCTLVEIERIIRNAKEFLQDELKLAVSGE